MLPHLYDSSAFRLCMAPLHLFHVASSLTSVSSSARANQVLAGMKLYLLIRAAFITTYIVKIQTSSNESNSSIYELEENFTKLSLLKQKTTDHGPITTIQKSNNRCSSCSIRLPPRDSLIEQNTEYTSQDKKQYTPTTLYGYEYDYKAALKLQTRISELTGMIKDKKVEFSHTKELCDKYTKEIKELDNAINEIKSSSKSDNLKIVLKIEELGKIYLVHQEQVEILYKISEKIIPLANEQFLLMEKDLAELNDQILLDNTVDSIHLKVKAQVYTAERKRLVLISDEINEKSSDIVSQAKEILEIALRWITFAKNISSKKN